jgi:hypothetical protein
LHTNLTLALGGGNWFASDPSDITKRDQPPALIRQEGGWARKAVWMLWRKEKSLASAWNQMPFLTQPASGFATILIELVSSYHTNVSRTLKNSSLKDYKTVYDNNTICSFIWITSANNNRK